MFGLFIGFLVEKCATCPSQVISDGILRGGLQGGLEPYMIAPVKKFVRVRLSTSFPSKQIWRRMQTWKDDEFLLGFCFPAYKYQEKVSMDFFNGPFGHQEA